MTVTETGSDSGWVSGFGLDGGGEGMGSLERRCLGAAAEQHQALSDDTTVGVSRNGGLAAEDEIVVSRRFLRLVFGGCVWVCVLRCEDAAMNF